MSLTLRYMTTRDIGQVVEIDRAAFATPWSPRSYAYELQDSAYSHMVVLEDSIPAASSSLMQAVRRVLQRGVQPVNGANSPTQGGRVLAYGGLWRIADEAHISTIATHPETRGQGYGEIVLAAMIRRQSPWARPIWSSKSA
ncbi:GNAT family N-acetyltransferase [bacterium]|nr:GNAT family N-acetyltransferase [bacterium]